MTESWVERAFSAKEEHTWWPVADWWAVSRQGNKQPHSYAAALPTITNQPLPAQTLALWTREEGGDVPRGVLNCSDAESGPWALPLLEFNSFGFYSENLVLCKWTSPEEWLMSVSRIRDVDEWTALPCLNCNSLPLCFLLRISQTYRFIYVFTPSLN